MEILDQATSQEILVGLLIAFVCWIFGLVSKAAAVIVSIYRKMRVSSYINAISFTESEVNYALKDYIKPFCSDTDPAQFSEPREAIGNSCSPLKDYVDNFVKKSGRKHLFIYADSGMGKTTFLINYYHNNRSRFIARSHDMVLVSLSKGTSEIEIAETPLAKQRSTILLLDALDEDRFIYDDPAGRVRRLLEISANYKAVIITCRSQFFRDDSSLPISSGVARSGPTPANESKEYVIDRIYISPFSDRQISRFLKMRYPGVVQLLKRRRAKEIVRKVPYLPVRPMLLAHISDVLSAQSEIRTHADVYQAIISSWAKREDRWISAKDLLDFSSDLALELYLNRDNRNGEFCTVEELKLFALASGQKVKTSFLTGRSLLNRTSGGAVKFSHRSILEYFVATRVVSATHGLRVRLTDQMLVFVLEMLGSPDVGTDSGLLKRPATLETVSPELRSGYSTNFNIYRVKSDSIHVHSLMAAKIRVPADVDCGIDLFSDLLVNLFKFIGGGGSVEVRIMVPLSSKKGFVDCYLSCWNQGHVTLSHIQIDASCLSAAFGFSPNRDVCIVGNGYSVEGMSWLCTCRSDVTLAARDRQMVERSPRVGCFVAKSGGLELLLISGRPVLSPLASFGILSGGSYFSVERRLFTRLPSSQVESGRRIGDLVPQEKVKVPASERWPVR